MGYAETGTQFGQKKWSIYSQPPLTPISNGLDVFSKGFRMVRGAYDDFVDTMHNIPIVGPGIDMLLDNPIVGEMLGFFDLLGAGTELLQPFFETIEPITDPILREAMQEMGLNIPAQLSPEQVEALQRGGPGRATLAEEARPEESLGDVTAVSAPPPIFVPLTPGTSMGNVGIGTT